MSAPATAAVTIAAADLALADLAAFDPMHRRRDGECDSCCPLCGTQKKIDAAHRSLSYNARTGLWRCARCQSKGILREFRREGEGTGAAPALSRYDRSHQARTRLRQVMQLPPPLPSSQQGQPASLPPQSSVPASESTAAEDWRQRALGGLRPLPGTPGAAYLRERRGGLPADFCHAAGVRYSSNFLGRPAIVFPVRDENGALVAVQGRYIDNRDNPRMRTLGERRKGVFLTAPEALKPGDRNASAAAIVLTEAPLDALSLAYCSSGDSTDSSSNVLAIALCGCEGLPRAILLALAFRTVYLAFDSDEAGERAAGQVALLLRGVGATAVRLAPPSGAKDWNEALARWGRERLTGYLRQYCPAFKEDAAGGEENDPQEEEAWGTRLRALVAAAQQNCLPIARTAETADLAETPEPTRTADGASPSLPSPQSLRLPSGRTICNPNAAVLDAAQRLRECVRIGDDPGARVALADLEMLMERFRPP